jgi:hypothetical protein
MKRMPVLLLAMAFVMFVCGCTQSPKSVVKAYVQKSRGGNQSAARNLCSGSASAEASKAFRSG